jgi:sporulation-control protein
VCSNDCGHPFATAGPSVETLVDTPELLPGGVVRGRVRVRGAKRDVVVLRLVAGLVAQVKVENRRDERRELYASRLADVVLVREVLVGAGELVEVPFTLPAPWDTPFTAVGDALLPLTVAVRAELVSLHALDATDLTPVTTRPLPSQSVVLEAFGQLGAVFTAVDAGLSAMPQVVRNPDGFPLVLEFAPPTWCGHRLVDVRLMFHADHRELRVYLSATRRGLLGSRTRLPGYFEMPHEQARTADWPSMVRAWLTGVAG